MASTRSPERNGAPGIAPFGSGDTGAPASGCKTAVEGLGIALVAMPQAAPYLRAGALQRVLPDWYVDAGTIAIYFAAHKLPPAKTRVFIDFVVEQFRTHQWAQLFGVY